MIKLQPFCKSEIMKTVKLLLLWLGLIFVMKTSADIIIISDTHVVNKCIKITNLSDYPEISLIGILYSYHENGNTDAYLVNSDVCLYRRYKMYKFEIRAARNDYLAGRNLAETKWASNENTLLSSIALEPNSGYVTDSNPLSDIEEFFRIAGFTDTSVVLYKWKEIRKYNNGLADSVKTYEYTGNVQSLSQTIPTGIQHQNQYSGIRVYPNPARETLTLASIEGYTGDVKAELVNSSGKVVKLYRLLEGADNSVYPLSISRLSPGLYFLKIHLGNITEVRKVVIE